ncbi:lipopolysaccharide biosynthesis protein [Metabacillus idriensis]|uniref:lipopolysaccharide biosynthesis protein n=1 Tax=Metabacillus idriensis TaxID=324768 RepID=UPI001748C3FB|nr:oligosaccharide flippase family protein [Metabacillus idriensis]
MRINNSIKNMSISILSQLIIVLLGFISRKVFIDSLGVEYLGVNGLLTNVLSMLALIESGIGASIVYSLYKPLVENDKPKIIALIQLYKKAYRVVAIIIIFLSVILYPILENLINSSESIPYIMIAYFIFVAKNMITYFNAHKESLINVDQKGYILARLNIVFQIFITISKIMVLLLTNSFILYLIIELIICIIQTIYNSKIVDKRYSYIKTKEKYYIDRLEKDSLIKNIKALFLHNIGGYAVLGTDNILIASFVGIATVGLYSNYSMIIGQLSSLLAPLFSGLGDSIGNLIASEKSDKSYSIFKVLYLVNFWIYSVSVIFLFNLLEPFVNWWLGEGYLLDSLTVLILFVNFYITGMRSSIFTFKVKGGIFVQDKYMPLIGAAINLGSSIVLVKYMGLAGIFLGTTISTLTVFWNAPYLVYKHIFNIPVWSYFKKYIFYLALTLGTCFITTKICNLLVLDSSFMSILVKGIICLIVPNLLYFSIFFRNREFQYIKNVSKNLLINLKLKFTSTTRPCNQKEVR